MDRIFACCLHRSIAISSSAPCRILLRHRQVVHVLSCPFVTLSSRLTEVRWCVLSVLLGHSLHRMTLGEEFLNFMRLSAGIFQYRACDLFVSCFALFYSSAYISSDVRWHNSRQQVHFLYISWFETSRDCSACIIEL